MPVMPGRSSTLSTFATQPALTTFGWSFRGTSRNCMPLGREKSSTATCWAKTAGVEAAAASTRRKQRAKRRSVGWFRGCRGICLYP